MESYHFPTRASEVVFCRDSMNSTSCSGGHGFDPERTNLPLSVLEVKQSSRAGNRVLSVFATDDIPSLSYIGLNDFIHMIHLSPKSYKLAMKMNGHHSQSTPLNDQNATKWRAHVVATSAVGFGHSYGHRVSILVASSLRSQIPCDEASDSSFFVEIMFSSNRRVVSMCFWVPRCIASSTMAAWATAMSVTN